MDKIESLAKRRGFIFKSSEIYGGLAGIWDYGPLGTALKNNIKREWWRLVVEERDDVVGLDSTILTPPPVLKASGHAEHFFDLMVDCKKCRSRFKVEDLYKNSAKKELDKCLNCGANNWGVIGRMGGMFKTYIGTGEDEDSVVYLRPETAQGIFVNFKNVIDTMRVKVPFGIAQIGRVFRNEVTPGNFIFRQREFEMMEVEYFVKPGTDEKWHEQWVEDRFQWYLNLGIQKKNLKVADIPQKDLAHYSKRTQEIHYAYTFMPAGWGELEGIANRTDYDLKAHHLKYYDDENKKTYIPYVIEPSVGVDRIVLALLLDAYHEEKEKEERRIILKLHPRLAPYQIAVFPLLANKQNLVSKAEEIYQLLRPRFRTSWDDRGNIGKRYFSQDEIGTPWCVTIDFQTLEDDTVTIRDRDTKKQERFKISELINWFTQKCFT